MGVALHFFAYKGLKLMYHSVCAEELNCVRGLLISVTRIACEVLSWADYVWGFLVSFDVARIAISQRAKR